MKKVFTFLTSVCFAAALAAAIPQYQVAEAINAGLAQNDSIAVKGVITSIDFYIPTFIKTGSVNISIKDATGQEGEFELVDCYALEADSFKTTTPEFDPTSKKWFKAQTVTSKNGTVICIGDTLVAEGKYEYNETSQTYGLQADCYLTSIAKGDGIPEPTKVNLVFDAGYVDAENFLYDDYVDIVLANFTDYSEEGQPLGDGDWLQLDIYPDGEDPLAISATYSIEDQTMDDYWSFLTRVQGTDTANIQFSAGYATITINEYSEEDDLPFVDISVKAELTADDIVYTTDTRLELYIYLPDQDIDTKINNAEVLERVVKTIQNGQIFININGVRYNINGAIVK